MIDMDNECQIEKSNHQEKNTPILPIIHKKIRFDAFLYILLITTYTYIYNS